jgi:hypothetical protein
MKIALVSPMKFIAAVIIGIVLAMAISAILAPHPVETPPIEITPVPTPAPVYIQPTTPQPDNLGFTVVSLLPLFIAATGVFAMIFPILVLRND